MESVDRQAADEDAERDRGRFAEWAGAFGAETVKLSTKPGGNAEASSYPASVRLPVATSTPSAVTSPRS